MKFLFNILCRETTLYQAWKRVKAKGSVGGVDGVTLLDFDKNKWSQLKALLDELKTSRWSPLPYWEIEVSKTKNPDEKRRLGMTTIRDKIVQQAIKDLLEPRCERQFCGNSYGYRPGKGATKAIRRVLQECRDEKYQFVLRLDIDNFFDNIDHDILQRRLATICSDEEVVRLVMLIVKMGRVQQSSGRWIQTQEGTPQGAILSPLLSNLYLSSFDQYAVSRGVPYIRYADDFLFLCETAEQAEDIYQRTAQHLQERLKLSLNEPHCVIPLSEGFDFLGVAIKNHQVSITEEKRKQLCNDIRSLAIDSNGFSAKSKRAIDGITRYYGKLLPQEDLEALDNALVERVKEIIESTEGGINSKTALRFVVNLLPFMSKRYHEQVKVITEDLVEHFVSVKGKDQLEDSEQKNKKLIQQRKKEFRLKEAEASGLLVNKPGAFIGLTSRGVTVSKKGKLLARYHPGNLSHIVITGRGVSMSSNLLDYCMANKIPIDIFDKQGTHIGSFLSTQFMQSTLWEQQAMAGVKQRNTIALSIIEGKVKNQHALLKYFHKYHKLNFPNLSPAMEQMNGAVDHFKTFKKEANLSEENFTAKLMGHEAQVAICYWGYIRELLMDDEVGFVSREHQGAQDLVNCMLNYGYSMLYVRIWQSLLVAKLNPFDGVIHARRDGKPALVYDMIEIFRSQVVDRIVISLVQKGYDLGVNNGLLTDSTRQTLAKAVMERLARYEKYKGQEMKMEQIIERQTKQLAEFFASGEKFKPYIAKW